MLVVLSHEGLSWHVHIHVRNPTYHNLRIIIYVQLVYRILALGYRSTSTSTNTGNARERSEDPCHVM